VVAYSKAGLALTFRHPAVRACSRQNLSLPAKAQCSCYVSRMPMRTLATNDAYILDLCVMLRRCKALSCLLVSCYA